MNRRGFLASCLALSAAPAIVRAESLMKLWVPPQEIYQFLPGAVGHYVATPDLGSTLMEAPEFTSSTWTKVEVVWVRDVFVFNSALISEELRKITR